MIKLKFKNFHLPNTCHLMLEEEYPNLGFFYSTDIFPSYKFSPSCQRKLEKKMNKLKEDLQQEGGMPCWESELITVRSKKGPMGWLCLGEVTTTLGLGLSLTSSKI